MKRVILLLAVLLVALPAYAGPSCSTNSLIGLGVNDVQAQALGCDSYGAALVPDTDDSYDLGSTSLEWQDLYIDGTANLDAAVITTLTYSKSITYFVPAGSGRAGATAGWVNTGTDINEATMAAGGTASTFTIPVDGLMIGDVVTSFKVIAQIESAGNTATLDADLRKLTNAAGDPTDASIGAITQVSATADTAVSSSKTLAAAETIASGESLYVLLTGTTAASTDIRLLGVEIVVTRTY